MKNALLSILLAAIPFLITGSEPELNLVGASGVSRSGNDLLIVFDKDPGAYYRFPLEGQTSKRILIDNRKLIRVAVPEASMALDLEGITVLADGRVALLSEGLAAVASGPQIVAEYPGPFGEFGGIGLEGIASFPLENGNSRIAVIWEGGYPQPDKSPLQLRAKVGEISLRPVLVIHDLAKNGTTGRILNGSLTIRELRVFRPIGKEPFVQRFRVPDLVWHRYNNGGTLDWCIIALLSSRNALKSPQYLNLWLQRFDLHGKPIGNHLDLKKLLPEDMRNLNWEGLGWFEEGKRLVTVFDNNPNQPTEAFIVDIPEEWK
jgi:hypothetical protein